VTVLFLYLYFDSSGKDRCCHSNQHGWINPWTNYKNGRTRGSSVDTVMIQNQLHSGFNKWLSSVFGACQNWIEKQENHNRVRSQWLMVFITIITDCEYYLYLFLEKKWAKYRKKRRACDTHTCIRVYVVVFQFYHVIYKTIVQYQLLCSWKTNQLWDYWHRRRVLLSVQQVYPLGVCCCILPYTCMYFHC